MTALTDRINAVPELVEGRCVITDASQPPPCPGDPKSPVECDGGYNYTGVEHMGHEESYPCQTCHGSGVAPIGTTVLLWTDSGVVAVGTLDEVELWGDGYSISLTDVRLLDPPITEWTQIEMVGGGSLPMTKQVVSLNPGWQRCPTGLMAAVKEAS